MRHEFIQHLNNLAGNLEVDQISSTWHDVDKIEDEFTAEEGFTVFIKKNKIEYKKDFFGVECFKPIPEEILTENPELSVAEYNAKRILDEMEIK